MALATKSRVRVVKMMEAATKDIDASMDCGSVKSVIKEMSPNSPPASIA